jgi:CHAT domain-containing protein
MRLAEVRPALALLIICFLAVNVYAQNEPANVRSEFESFATDLVTTKSPQQRELLLAQKKYLVTPDLRKALIRQGNTRLLAGQYSTAFDIYALAQNIAEQIGDKEGIASALLDIGTVYYFQANYPAALEHYQKARALFSEVQNNYESAKALSGLALIYKEQRHDTDALAAFQQALKEFNSLGDKEEMANALSSIGAIYYGQGNYTAAAEAFNKSNEANSNVDNIVRLADALYMQGDYSQALNYYKQSLARLSPQDLGAMIASLNGAANSAYYQGNYEEALQYYQRNVTVQETQSDKQGLAISLKGIGNVHRSRGDFGAALENYFKSLNISEVIKAPTGTILGSIGLVHALRGDYERSLVYYRKALTEFEASGNKIETARVLNLIGNVYYAQGSYELALESYGKALALREEADDKAGQGDLLAGIGSTFLKQKKYSEALDSYQKALGVFNSLANKERIADVLTRISNALLLKGEYAQALSAADSAVSLAKQVENLEVLWYAEVIKGKAHRELDDATQAYQAFNDAIAIVESMRARPVNVAGAEHNSSLPYLSALDLQVSRDRAGEAFVYAERAKVQSLFDLLRNGNASTNKGLSTAEQVEEQRLAGEAASLELQLNREQQLRTSSETRRASLRDRLRQVRSAYAGFRQKLLAAHPLLRTGRGDLAPLKIDELRSLVDDSQTALLEYTITDTNTYLFVLTASDSPKIRSQAKRTAAITLKVYPLNIGNDQLAYRVRQLEEKLASHADDFEEPARELYSVLLEPAADQLLLKTKLIVVPDGVLWRLPFEALQPEENRYVVDQMQVAYAPSLSALRDMRKQRAPLSRVNRLLLAFGNPLLSKEFTSRIELAYTDTKLQSSPQQEDEINDVGRSYGQSRSRLFTGTEANVARLKVEASRAGMLHFAAPALLDDTSPMSSFVGLSSGPDKQGEGFLQAREIINLQTTAQLVTLSDAQSKGNFAGGAATGWSWSWFVAGSPATMFSRWQIQPAAVSQLMTQFYSTVRPGNRNPHSKAGALHQSVMSLRRSAEYQHPHYWASFVMIGDAR